MQLANLQAVFQPKQQEGNKNALKKNKILIKMQGSSR